ncbi:MAG: hypothetical protein Q8P90_01655 [bacterium]|nr:hypothetical protein [bacterium]
MADPFKPGSVARKIDSDVPPAEEDDLGISVEHAAVLDRAARYGDLENDVEEGLSEAEKKNKVAELATTFASEDHRFDRELMNAIDIKLGAKHMAMEQSLSGFVEYINEPDLESCNKLLEIFGETRMEFEERFGYLEMFKSRMQRSEFPEVRAMALIIEKSYAAMLQYADLLSAAENLMGKIKNQVEMTGLPEDIALQQLKKLSNKIATLYRNELHKVGRNVRHALAYEGYRAYIDSTDDKENLREGDVDEDYLYESGIKLDDVKLNEGDIKTLQALDFRMKGRVGAITTELFNSTSEERLEKNRQSLETIQKVKMYFQDRMQIISDILPTLNEADSIFLQELHMPMREFIIEMENLFSVLDRAIVELNKLVESNLSIEDRSLIQIKLDEMQNEVERIYQQKLQPFANVVATNLAYMKYRKGVTETQRDETPELVGEDYQLNVAK